VTSLAAAADEALLAAASTGDQDGGGLSVVLDHTSRLTFLLIEDSSSDSELVMALLESEFVNAEIHTATNLDTALSMLADGHYDLVLADLTLPDADGATVVRTVRTAYPHTALMVLTGRIDGALALWALAEGAQDYLVKGQHDGPRLATALLHGLQRCRAEQQAHTRLVAALEKESQAVERLNELNEAKSDFVATVSHELRTPLTSIAAYAELLQEDAGLTPWQAQCVDVISRSADRLSSLADDLLLLSGFSSPEYVVEAGEVDLRAVVHHAQEVLGTLGAGRSLAVAFDLPDAPVVVSGDAEHLERVVLNLMSNAIKFSEDGGSISCRLSVTAQDAVLVVADNGMGIPLAEQPELFTKFFRGSSARDRAIQGTGLGLHIVASIVQSHGGDVSVVSEHLHGATFTVRLPLGSASAELDTA
jgi:signal transduction histidine kinase